METILSVFPEGAVDLQCLSRHRDSEGLGKMGAVKSEL